MSNILGNGQIVPYREKLDTYLPPQNYMTITKIWYNYSKGEITTSLISNKDFDQEIKMVKTIEKERRSYMTYAMKLQEERKKGIKEGILSTVRSMLEDGLSVERVAKIAKLPEEQVMEIKSQIPTLQS